MASDLGSQVWYCNACCTMGVVKFDFHEDSYSVLNKIRDGHSHAGAMQCDEPPRILMFDSIKKDTIFMGVGASK